MTAIRPSRRTRRTRFAGIALVAPLALGLAACGDSDDDTDDAPAAVVTVTATPSPTTPDDGTAVSPSASATSGSTSGGDLQTAALTALGAVDGTVFTVDRDDSGGWEVSVVTSDGTDNEVGVAADATTITRGPAVDTDDGDDQGDDQAERERLLGASVDYLAAVEAALAEVPGGTVTGVDLDEDNGTATWDVELDGDTADETTVDVDASTGDVLRTERDD